MRSIPVLAQIRLNLSSVEQFLAAACSLAEDNPNIRSGVEEARREIRSAALLIDHLRNLFGHQHYIQQEAALNAPLYHHHHQHQQEDGSSKLFTYSTRLTLVKASKSLVANVAKILYLTDSVVLSSAGGQENSAPDSSSSSSNNPGQQLAGPLSDRLDNVANYSQLLRSFGELGGELVDLGQCLMLSQHYEDQYGRSFRPAAQLQQQQQQPDRAHSSPAGQAHWSSLASLDRQQQSLDYIRNEEQTFGRLLERQSNENRPHENSNLRPSFSSYSIQAPQLPPRNHNRMPHHQTHRGSLSAGGRQLQLRGGPLPVLWDEQQPVGGAEEQEEQEECAYRAPPEASRRPLQDATNRVILQDDLDETSGQSWLMSPANNNLLESDIQDMQVLFQVNRLTIDRFILLLLSASKCCLRQGDEYLRGLEARRSIVVQIRASISIIMALVKGAVFSCAGTNNFAAPQMENYFSISPAELTAAYNINKSLAGYPQRATAGAAIDNKRLIDGPNSAQLSAGASLFIKSRQLSLPTGGHGGAGLTARDNQFAGQQHYYQQQAGRQTEELRQHPPAHFRWQAHAGSDFHQQSRGLPHALDFANDMLPEHQRRAQFIARKPLQIMNFFLKTWNGTQSANDAINKLQTLVGLFGQVNNYKQLVGALNASFLGFELAQAEAAARNNQPEGLANEVPLGAGSGDSPIVQPRRDYALGYAISADSKIQQQAGGSNMLLMNKRQLVRALNAVFLGEVKIGLTERVHEFTDCPYTRHEHRENILSLLQSIRFQLNKLVKLLYKLRRRSSSINELSLAQVRQLALQIEEACAELKCELQTVVIELGDELDRTNGQLELVKELKHFCLVGDLGRLENTSALFMEQTEQLVEVCKMLNQISPTNKMKLTTRSVGIWFELNAGQLLACASCLAQNPHSKVLKECTWAYIQVWSSFYDDFCQIARQIAYLSHAHFDSERSVRVASVRDEILMRRGLDSRPNCTISGGQTRLDVHRRRCEISEEEEAEEQAEMFAPGSADLEQLHRALPADWPVGQASSAQSLNLPRQPYSADTDSPRSLDHYYGFGQNYQLRRHNGDQSDSFRRELEDERLEILAASPLSYCQPAGYSDNFRANFSSGGSFGESPEASCAPLCPDGCCRGPPEQQLHHQHQPIEPVVVPLVDCNCEQDNDEFIRAPMPPPARKGLPENNQPPMCVRPEGEAPRRSREGKKKNRKPSSIVSTLDEEDSDGGLEATGNGSGTEHQPATSMPSAPAAAAPASRTLVEPDKWDDSSDPADAIVRGAKETAQMALSMYQFTKGEGDLNTTQDLFTQAELFAEEANEIYKEVRCFSYKIPAGELKKELLAQLATIPALVQQLQFVVKNPTVGKPATFAKVDGVIRETRALMEAVNRVVSATLACRQHYNMAIASMRKRTRTLSPTYRNDKGGFEFNNSKPGNFGGRAGAGAGNAGGGGMGSEPDI